MFCRDLGHANCVGRYGRCKPCLGPRYRPQPEEQSKSWRIGPSASVSPSSNSGCWRAAGGEQSPPRKTADHRERQQAVNDWPMARRDGAGAQHETDCEPLKRESQSAGTPNRFHLRNSAGFLPFTMGRFGGCSASSVFAVPPVAGLLRQQFIDSVLPELHLVHIAG